MLLHCARWPAPTAPTATTQSRLVFLHGMGGTGALWRPLAAVLEDRYSILAPDQRGHGRSQVTTGGTPHYSPLDYGQDVVETLEALDFHPTWLVGHSMGVRTACAVAHLRPEWVQGVVLVDLGFSGAAGGGLGENLARFLQILPMEFSSRNEARNFMEQNCPDASIGQYLMAVSVWTPTPSDPPGRLTFPFDKSALIQTIQRARDSTVENWIQEMGMRNTPVVALRGAQSGVWSREEFEAEKARFAPYPSIRFEEVPGAGHGLPFEKRIEFTQLLKNLIG